MTEPDAAAVLGAVAVTLAGIARYTVLASAGPSVVRVEIMGGIYLFTTRQLGRPAGKQWPEVRRNNRI